MKLGRGPGRPTPPRLLAVTDGRMDLDRARRPELLSWLCRLDRLGIGVQLREKSLSDAELLALARHVREHFRGPLLINTRPDVAVASDAEGVHLTSRSFPLRETVRCFSSSLLVGISTHSPEEVAAAAVAGADYAVFGPIFETPSKAGLGEPQGLERLRRVCASCDLPVLAIGGLDASRAASVVECGAWGIAAIRAFEQPESLLSGLDRGPGP